MGLNEVASAERIHIGFFGIRNAGKSSVVNAITGQRIAVVSDVKGTTTDPVRKSMELLPLGPVVIIDTPGFDDEGSLGDLRVERTKKVLHGVDIAVLVADVTRGLTDADKELIGLFEERKIPYVIAYNKCDLLEDEPAAGSGKPGGGAPGSGETGTADSAIGGAGTEQNERSILISAEKDINIFELKEMIGRFAGTAGNQKQLIRDLIEPNDVIVLVIPIDKAAPKGRLILPQQQTIRDILEAGASAVVTRDAELAETLKSLSKKPKMVITDSQVFGKVAEIVPEDIMLTSFSILFARYKGNLRTVVQGAACLEKLGEGDRLLISEGCTHHRQCGDIGTDKLPKMIKKFTGFDLEFDTSSGGDFPDDLKQYALVLHCGGCMLNEREMNYRLDFAGRRGVPITNYGIAIALMNGILKRSLEPFPDILAELE